MTQVLEFALPDLGEGLTEALIVRWLVEVGEVVEVDQPVVEVETAKAMVEVPCPHGGVVTARFGDEGTDLPVGAPLITVAVGGATAGSGAGSDSTGTGVGAGSGAGTGSASSGTGPGTAEDSGSGNVLVGYGTGSAVPVRRRRVRGGATPTVTTPVVAAPPEPARLPVEGPVPVISPLVRKLARDHGLDLRSVTGSGPEGLILRADVERLVRDGGALLVDATPAPEPAETGAAATEFGAVDPGAPALGAPASRSAATAAPDGEEVRLPLRGMRGVAADKLSRSRREIPDATCWVDADATELLRARAAMNAADGPRISLLALFARISTAALARFPELNSRVDTEAREIVRLPAVHLGYAAQTDRGLVVPVVRDAHRRDAVSLSGEFARLTGAAREGRLSPAQLTGGTFTLNNYGVFGVDGSTPIINHPEAAMLGVGRITAKPWVHEGELAVRQVVQLSLTFDHRVCDGGVAGGFLRYVADCVEQPAVLLRSL